MPAAEPAPDASDVLACLGQAVIGTDLDGVVRFWNPAAEKLYGWTAREAIGRNVGDLVVPEISRETGMELMEALRSGRPWSGAFPVRGRDGAVFTALVTDAGLLRDGELIGIVGVSTNLGAALGPLLERSSDAALVLRPDTTIVYASPAVRELFGWRVRDVLGDPLTDLVHRDQREVLLAALATAIRHPGIQPPVELRVSGHGTWLWCEAAFTSLQDDPGVRGVVCNLRTSTHRLLQDAAELRAQQLERALTSRVIVEQAKGFVAALEGSAPDEAFERIRSYARSHRQELHDVARRLVARQLVLPR